MAVASELSINGKKVAEHYGRFPEVFDKKEFYFILGDRGRR